MKKFILAIVFLSLLNIVFWADTKVVPLSENIMKPTQIVAGVILVFRRLKK